MATLNGVNYSNTSGLLLKTNATTQMSISTGGVIEFNQSYTFPTSDGSANTVLLTNGSGALSFSTIPNASLDNSSLTVTAGSGLANGGSVSLGGSVTLNVGAGTGIVVNANDVALDYAGTNNFIDSATNLEGTSIATSDTIVYHDATDNNVKKGLVSDLPFTSNVGDITSVTAGNGLTGGGTSGAVTLDVGAGTGLVANANDIALDTGSNLNIDHSTVTMTAGNGLTGGGTIAASRTFNVGAGTGISVDANTVGLDTSNSRNVDHSSVSISAGTGLSGGGTIASNRTISLDYAGVDNAILAATDATTTTIDTGSHIWYSDGSQNINFGLVSDLPFTNNSGTVTSVAISGTDGIDVDSGSPITTSGTITLGLSNVPNSSLANSSVTVGTTSISLGSSSTTLAGLTSVTSTAFIGDLTGDVNGNASTADTWANSRTLTLGTDLSGNVSFDGSANFTLNASIVSGAVGSTELATNAVTTAKITDGNVTNAKLANSSFTVNAPSGTDPVVPLGGTLNFTSSDSSVTIAGNSTTDTIDLIVAGSVNTYVTGGTFTSGTLSLGLNDGTSAQDISGFWSSIPNSALSNSTITINGSAISLGGSINVGDITGVSAGTGLTGGGTSGSVTVSVDYAGTDNFIDSATDLEGTDIALTDTIVYHDATDNNVKKGLVSDLPFTNTSGTVTSVAISGSDGIDVDSGSPITSSGTIALGLSNVPNSSLANSSITINGTAVSLGGTINVGDITGVSAGTGLTGGGTSGSVTVSLDYAGTDNYIYAAGTGTGDITTSMYIPVSDASNNVKKYTVSALPFTDNTGTVTSVAISGSDGIDVDSGSPITTNGTIALGLSNVPNSSLANSSVTVTGGNGLTGGGSASLGGSVTLNVGAGTLIDVDGSNVNVDLSELTTSTANGDGDYFVVVDTANAQKKLTKANINLSGFNDDVTIYESDGTLAATRTVTQGGNDLQVRANSGAESFKVYKTTNTSNTQARVFIEGDDNYQNVLELYTTASANLVEGFDQGQAPVFTVDSQGNLTAVSKAFDIPHPNPEKQAEGMRLKHGNLEGPEHGIYIRGRQLNDKEIELPEYWKDLVDPDSITVQLTSVGSHQNLYVKEIKDWVVYIQNGNLFSNKIDCYYFIQAERIDVDKIQVEYTK